MSRLFCKIYYHLTGGCTNKQVIVKQATDAIAWSDGIGDRQFSHLKTIFYLFLPPKNPLDIDNQYLYLLLRF